MITAIVQARMTSTRLKGKVMMLIEGKPVIWHVINRLKMSENLDDIILAIPESEESDVLVSFSEDNKLKYIRGSEDDVLDRYYKAAKKFNVDIILRATGDCPLLDPKVIDDVIEKHLKTNADYTANNFERSFPLGLDVEVFNFSSLERSKKEATTDFEKEHVVPYMNKNPKLFHLENLEAPKELRRPDLRLTVDTKEDLDFVRKIYSHFNNPFFTTKEIIDLYDNKLKKS